MIDHTSPDWTEEHHQASEREGDPDILTNDEVDAMEGSSAKIENAVARQSDASVVLLQAAARFDAIIASHRAQAARIKELENPTYGTSTPKDYVSPVCPICHQRHDTSSCT